MKKSRIFMASGALLLAISAIFATKANKQFTGLTLHTALIGTSDYSVYSPSALFTGVRQGYFKGSFVLGTSSRIHVVETGVLNTSPDGASPVYMNN
jgi:hypothetical protein